MMRNVLLPALFTRITSAQILTSPDGPNRKSGNPLPQEGRCGSVDDDVCDDETSRASDTRRADGGGEITTP